MNKQTNERPNECHETEQQNKEWANDLTKAIIQVQAILKYPHFLVRASGGLPKKPEEILWGGWAIFKKLFFECFILNVVCLGISTIYAANDLQIREESTFNVRSPWSSKG